MSDPHSNKDAMSDLGTKRSLSEAIKIEGEQNVYEADGIKIEDYSTKDEAGYQKRIRLDNEEDSNVKTDVGTSLKTESNLPPLVINGPIPARSQTQIIDAINKLKQFAQVAEQLTASIQLVQKSLENWPVNSDGDGDEKEVIPELGCNLRDAQLQISQAQTNLKAILDERQVVVQTQLSNFASYFPNLPPPADPSFASFFETIDIEELESLMSSKRVRRIPKHLQPTDNLEPEAAESIQSDEMEIGTKKPRASKRATPSKLKSAASTVETDVYNIEAETLKSEDVQSKVSKSSRTKANKLVEQQQQQQQQQQSLVETHTNIQPSFGPNDDFYFYDEPSSLSGNKLKPFGDLNPALEASLARVFVTAAKTPTAVLPYALRTSRVFNEIMDQAVDDSISESEREAATVKAFKLYLQSLTNTPTWPNRIEDLEDYAPSKHALHEVFPHPDADARAVSRLFTAAGLLPPSNSTKGTSGDGVDSSILSSSPSETPHLDDPVPLSTLPHSLYRLQRVGKQSQTKELAVIPRLPRYGTSFTAPCLKDHEESSLRLQSHQQFAQTILSRAVADGLLCLKLPFGQMQLSVNAEQVTKNKTSHESETESEDELELHDDLLHFESTEGSLPSSPLRNDELMSDGVSSSSIFEEWSGNALTVDNEKLDSTNSLTSWFQVSRFKIDANTAKVNDMGDQQALPKVFDDLAKSCKSLVFERDTLVREVSRLIEGFESLAKTEILATHVAGLPRGVALEATESLMNYGISILKRFSNLSSALETIIRRDLNEASETIMDQLIMGVIPTSRREDCPEECDELADKLARATLPSVTDDDPDDDGLVASSTLTFRRTLLKSPNDHVAKENQMLSKTTDSLDTLNSLESQLQGCLLSSVIYTLLQSLRKLYDVRKSVIGVYPALQRSTKSSDSLILSNYKHCLGETLKESSHEKPEAGESKVVNLLQVTRDHITVRGQALRSTWSALSKEIAEASPQLLKPSLKYGTGLSTISSLVIPTHLNAPSSALSQAQATKLRRVSRDVLSYWRRYERDSFETMRREQKQLEDRRRKMVEEREAIRQQKKLEFILAQSELFSHFIGSKLADSKAPSGRSEVVEARLVNKPLIETKALAPELADAGAEVYSDENDLARKAAQAATNYLRNLEGGVRQAERAYELAREEAVTYSTSAEYLAEQEAINEVAKEDAQLQQAAASPSAEVEVIKKVPKAEEGMQESRAFKGELKPYQRKGLSWLVQLYDQGISGILADEMGLGKTVQAIAFLAHLAIERKIWGPFLIVAPNSTLHQWCNEVSKFCPSLKVLPYWGTQEDRRVIRKFWKPKQLYVENAQFHVLVTSYQLLVKDLSYFNRIQWQFMVLDEAHALKNSSSQRWKSLLSLKCRNRLLLTGTPIQNNMNELWALLHFIMPEFFDSLEEFNKWFSKDIERDAAAADGSSSSNGMDTRKVQRLHLILKPFMLRRIKADVQNELAPKTEKRVDCYLSLTQMNQYRAIEARTGQISFDDIALDADTDPEEATQQSSEAQSSTDGSTLTEASVQAPTSNSVVTVAASSTSTSTSSATAAKPASENNLTGEALSTLMQFRKICDHALLFAPSQVRAPITLVREYTFSPAVRGARPIGSINAVLAGTIPLRHIVDPVSARPFASAINFDLPRLVARTFLDDVSVDWSPFRLPAFYQTVKEVKRSDHAVFVMCDALSSMWEKGTFTRNTKEKPMAITFESEFEQIGEVPWSDLTKPRKQKVKTSRTSESIKSALKLKDRANEKAFGKVWRQLRRGFTLKSKKLKAGALLKKLGLTSHGTISFADAKVSSKASANRTANAASSSMCELVKETSTLSRKVSNRIGASKSMTASWDRSGRGAQADSLKAPSDLASHVLLLYGFGNEAAVRADEGSQGEELEKEKEMWLSDLAAYQSSRILECGSDGRRPKLGLSFSRGHEASDAGVSHVPSISGKNTFILKHFGIFNPNHMHSSLMTTENQSESSTNVCKSTFSFLRFCDLSVGEAAFVSSASLLQRFIFSLVQRRRQANHYHYEISAKMQSSGGDAVLFPYSLKRFQCEVPSNESVIRVYPRALVSTTSCFLVHCGLTGPAAIRLPIARQVPSSALSKPSPRSYSLEEDRYSYLRTHDAFGLPIYKGVPEDVDTMGCDDSGYVQVPESPVNPFARLKLSPRFPFLMNGEKPLQDSRKSKILVKRGTSALDFNVPELDDIEDVFLADIARPGRFSSEARQVISHLNRLRFLRPSPATTEWFNTLTPCTSLDASPGRQPVMQILTPLLRATASIYMESCVAPPIFPFVPGDTSANARYQHFFNAWERSLLTGVDCRATVCQDLWSKHVVLPPSQGNPIIPASALATADVAFLPDRTTDVSTWITSELPKRGLTGWNASGQQRVNSGPSWYLQNTNQERRRLVGTAKPMDVLISSLSNALYEFSTHSNWALPAEEAPKGFIWSPEAISLARVVSKLAEQGDTGSLTLSILEAISLVPLELARVFRTARAIAFGISPPLVNYTSLGTRKLNGFTVLGPAVEVATRRARKVELDRLRARAAQEAARLLEIEKQEQERAGKDADDDADGDDDGEGTAKSTDAAEADASFGVEDEMEGNDEESSTPRRPRGRPKGTGKKPRGKAAAAAAAAMAAASMSEEGKEGDEEQNEADDDNEHENGEKDASKEEESSEPISTDIVEPSPSSSQSHWGRVDSRTRQMLSALSHAFAFESTQITFGGLLNSERELSSSASTLGILPWAKLSIPTLRERVLADSGKMRKLDKLLRKLKSEGHRVLLFTQFTSALELLEEFVKRRGYLYKRMDGSTTLSDRRDAVHEFSTNPDFFLFLLSTRAGALGINLTAADTVVFYDSDWNPTIDAQAMDRVHRIGQTKPVTIYRFVCTGTVEEQVLKRAQLKHNIQKTVYSGALSWESEEVNSGDAMQD